MFKKIALYIPLLFIVVSITAQTKPTGIATQVSVDATNGTWNFKQYAPNIVKATFKLTRYTTNENISDAVIAKPLNNEVKKWGDKNSPNTSIQWKDFIIEKYGDTIYCGNRKTVAINGVKQIDGFNAIEFDLQNDEKIYGGGERALPLNRKGYRFNLYNNPWYGYSEGADNLNYSVPFFQSSKGYGLFFDNPSKGYADIGKTNPSIFEAGFISGELNVYIIIGSTPKEILASYHKLTGTQPLPPIWALGNLMSRFGYRNEDEVRNVLENMNREKIPVDAIIFDLFWFGRTIKGTMGNLNWTSARYSRETWYNPQKMIADFKKQKIQTVLITEPFFVESSFNYDSSKKYQAVDVKGNPYQIKDFYFGGAGLLDIFRKDAKQWFWSKHKVQMDIGVEAWWGDLGEPEKHPSDLYHNLKDKGFTRLFSADEVHNLYGHEWTKMLFDEYAINYPSKRLFSLNRSGFAGSQRYSIFPWTGDVSRSWSGLRAQLPILLGMTMSGVPYVHSDAGGFAGGDGDNELYVRWLQFATFTPIFRPHGTALYDIDTTAFSFPSEAALIKSPYKEFAKSTIDLRYQLLPYNYTLAYEQTKNGKPLLAPLYYYYPNDDSAVNVQDAYMWGDAMLIAPVTKKAEPWKRIYLPEGKWYDFFTNQIYTGKDFADVSTNIEHIPVFVKAGSFIPTAIRRDTGVKKMSDNLIVHYYPSTQKSTYTLFNDDGVSKNSLATNKYELITFTGLEKEEAKGYEFTVTSNNGIYNGKPVKQNMQLWIEGGSGALTNIYINGIKQQTQTDTINYDRSLLVNFEFTGKPVKIEVK